MKNPPKILWACWHTRKKMAIGFGRRRDAKKSTIHRFGKRWTPPAKYVLAEGKKGVRT